MARITACTQHDEPSAMKKKNKWKQKINMSSNHLQSTRRSRWFVHKSIEIVTYAMHL